MSQDEQTQSQPKEQTSNSSSINQPDEEQPADDIQEQSLKEEMNNLKVDSEENQTDEEIEKFTEDNSELANEYKNKGNSLFKEGNWPEAILEYQQGLKFSNDKELRATLYSNMAICFMKREDYNLAKNYCLKVLKENEKHRKGRINLARCYEEQSNIEEAFEEYKKALEDEEGANEKDLKFVKDKITLLQPKIDEINEKKKTEVISGLKNIGNSILGYFGMSLDNFKLEQGPGGGYNVSFKQ